ncbi:MAG: DUF4139 domain-containing protein [Pseudomonadota bacterium]
MLKVPTYIYRSSLAGRKWPVNTAWMSRRSGLRINRWVLGLLLGSLPASFVAAETIEQRGRVVSVAVSMGQAHVLRELTVDASIGEHTLVITDLPSTMREDSLTIESGPGLALMSARVETLRPGSSPELQAAQARLGQESERLKAKNLTLKAMRAQLAHLDGLDSFAASSAADARREGTLNAGEIQKLTLFSFAERLRLTEAVLAIEAEAETSAERVEALARDESTLIAANGKPGLRALLVFKKTIAGASQLKAGYVVNDISWAPEYVLRHTSREQVALDNFVRLTRGSTDQWRDVEMALSTLKPSQGLRAPAVQPLVVELKRGAVPKSEPGQLADIDRQLVEINKPKDGDERSRPSQRAPRTFSLPIRVSVERTADAQTIAIGSHQLDAETYFVADPQRNESLTQMVKVTNSTAVPLEPGKVTLLRGNTFLGSTELPNVGPSESITLPFGVAWRMSTTRELISRDETVHGNRRRVLLRIRLSVNNRTDSEQQVRLFDRLPQAAPGVRSALASGAPTLSEDPHYQKSQREKGILRWDLAVPPSGDTATTVEYEYEVEFDRSFHLVSEARAAANQ